MNSSLEQKRLAILAKIRLSRVTYKNILTGYGENGLGSQDIRHSLGIPNFPKSMTLKFIEDHSLLLLVATGCLIYVATQKKSSRAENNSLANRSNNLIVLKNLLYRTFRIGSHILKNPDHHHITRWLGRLISQRIFKS
jgi:hypothetical protein